MSCYYEIYKSWQRDPELFWADAASDIHWHKPFDRVFDEKAGLYGRWFVGGECNTAYNCLDRNVAEGRGDETALIYDSPVTGTKRSFTFSELLHEVETFAAVLADKGVSKGDRVVIYMPMVPETLIAMLATARLGAIHSMVFGGFAANELASRIDDAKPKVVVSASCGVEPGRIVNYKPLLDAAIKIAANSPSSASSCSARWCTLLSSRDATTIGLSSSPKPSRRGARRLASRSRRQRLFISCTPPAPPDSPRASCATMAVTWSRSNGR